MCRSDFDPGEAGRGSAVTVLRNRQRARDAAYVRAALGTLGRSDLVLGHDVRDAEAATQPEHPERLGENRGLVNRQVDDAVGNDHVDRAVWQWDGLDLPL